VTALAALLLAAADMAAIQPGALEGRPAHESPLQARIDAAPAGATIEVEAGTWQGDLLIDKPLRLVGRGRPVLVGSGDGSVVRVRAPGVLLEGFDIDGKLGGDVSRDTSGVHVAAPRAIVRDCHIERALFGVYLREAPGTRVERVVIRGPREMEAGDKGSGVHVYNTDDFVLIGNDVQDTRDGYYIQSSSHGIIRDNRAGFVRYGLHYMSSDDNVFEDNVFERSDAGAVLMSSRHIEFRRNRFLHNRGSSSVGLLLKNCDDTLAEDNLFDDNARGVFIEGSARDVFRRNVIARSDAALVVYDSCERVRFEGNAFLGNLTPLYLSGRRTDTLFDGNYWSGNDVPDLDGDGITDRPYALGSLFDHLRGNLTAADLLVHSPAAVALAAAERAFPVLAPPGAVDHAPLAHPPHLSDVPAAGAGRRRQGVLAGSLAMLAAGAVVFRRRRA
jgi:nitrous oxidase accessory protein